MAGWWTARSPRSPCSRRGPDGVPLPLGRTGCAQPLAVLVRAGELRGGEVDGRAGRPGRTCRSWSGWSASRSGAPSSSSATWVRAARRARWAELRTPEGARCARDPARRVAGGRPGARRPARTEARRRARDARRRTSSRRGLGTAAAARAHLPRRAPSPRAGTGTCGAWYAPARSCCATACGGYGLRAGSFRLDEATPALDVGDPAGAVAPAFPGRVGPGGLRALLDNSGLVVRLRGRVVWRSTRPPPWWTTSTSSCGRSPWSPRVQLTRGC